MSTLYRFSYIFPIISAYRSCARAFDLKHLSPTAFAHKLMSVHSVQGGPKIDTIFLYALTLPKLTDFQNYFTFRIRRKCVIILSLKVPPHLKCVATLPCEMSSVLKATIENETSSVTTHFKKLTTGNNVFIVSVIV